VIKEVIILAGGLGTRLQKTVPDLPKTLAPIGNRPFLSYIFKYLEANKIRRVILSVGYMHDKVQEFVNNNFKKFNVAFAIEEHPLGTGGAVLNASKLCSEEDIVVLNGDTLFNVDLKKLSDFHKQNSCLCTLSLKPMKNFNRYGIVVMDKDGHIQHFLEKQPFDEGLINGGVYALNLKEFTSLKLPAKFSFETDFLEKYYASRKMMGLISDNYFIDIGIKEDFEKACYELPLQFNLNE